MRVNRLRVPLALLVALILGSAIRGDAVTYPSDDGGRPAAQCAFVDSSGAAVLCTSTNPLPTSAGPLSSSSDPIGFGRSWFQSSGVGGQSFTKTWTGMLLDSNTAVQLGPDTIQQLNVSYSRDGGRTFVLSLTNTAQLVGNLTGMIRLTDGSYILTGQTSAGGPAAFRTTDLATLTNGTGLGAPIQTVGAALQQGATILVTQNTGEVCRSTDNGGSYTCVNPAGIGLFSRMSLASPAASVWLVIDDAGVIGRSTNDGTVFSVITTIGAPTATDHGIICLTSSICLASGGSTIVRSTDAGASFPTTTLSVVGGMPGRICGFANFGSGTVAAVLAPALTTQPFAYRSTDFGVTWTATNTVLNTTGPSSAGCNGVSTSGGTGFFTTNNAGVTFSQSVFSVSLGAGQVQIKGDNGATLQLNALGEAIVAQGTGEAVATRIPWQVNAPVMSGTLRTQTSTSAANTAQALTVAAVAGQRVMLYRIDAFCAAAGTATFNLTDGVTIRWQGVAAAVPTAPAMLSLLFDNPFQTTLGAALVVNVGTCGVGNSSTINLVAQQQ